MDGLQAEFRTVEFRDAEVRGLNFRGYAAIFDTPWSEMLVERLGYSETVQRGAFRKALVAVNRGDYTVPLTWQHDRDKILTTTRSGNLKLKEDGKGLLVEARLPNTPLAQEVTELIRSGDVQGMSYGRETLPEDSAFSRKNGIIHRSIANVRKLLDTTLTWEPSFPDTSVELRTAGFAALSLQEIFDGDEAQIEDAAVDTSSAAFETLKRESELVIDILEGGGITG